MTNEIFEWLGKIVLIAGGGSFVVYQAFKHLAEKWLDAKFDQNLQHLVHKQNQEIERLRTELTKSFDRATKLHQREFEILPDIWDKVSESYWATAALVSRIQTYPDLNSMEATKVKDLLDQSELTDIEAELVIHSDDKTKKYIELAYWYRLHAVEQAHRRANILLSKIGIFVRDEIKEKLQAILDLVSGANTEDRINHEHPPIRHKDRLKTDIDRVASEGPILMANAEEMIKARLWDMP